MQQLFHDSIRVQERYLKDRFALTETIFSTNILCMRRYRDKAHRRNVRSVEYIGVTDLDIIKIKQEMHMIYNPDTNLLLSAFIEIPLQYRNKTFIMFFDDCRTLNEHLYDKRKGVNLSLHPKGVIFLFAKLSIALKHLQLKGSYHGDINEATIFIDQRNQPRILVYPEMHVRDSYIRAADILDRNDSFAHTGFLISPEFFKMLKDGLQSALSTQDLISNDVFSLGLLCVRLISPVSFYEAYNLVGLSVDIERLGYFLQSLGCFFNGHFGSILRQCLDISPLFRPDFEKLVDETLLYSSIEMSSSIRPYTTFSKEESTAIQSDTYIPHSLPSPPTSHCLNPLSPPRAASLSISSLLSGSGSRRRVPHSVLISKLFSLGRVSVPLAFFPLSSTSLYYGPPPGPSVASEWALILHSSGDLYYGGVSDGQKQGKGVLWKGTAEIRSVWEHNQPQLNHQHKITKDIGKKRFLNSLLIESRLIRGENGSGWEEIIEWEQEKVGLLDRNGVEEEKVLPAPQTPQQMIAVKKTDITPDTEAPEMQTITKKSVKVFDPVSPEDSFCEQYKDQMSKSPLRTLIQKNQERTYFEEEDSEMNRLKTQYLSSMSREHEESIVNYKDFSDLSKHVFVYEGNYTPERKYTGFASLHFRSGQRFYCYFENGVPSGRGTFYRLDGSRIDGIWRNGIYQNDKIIAIIEQDASSRLTNN